MASGESWREANQQTKGIKMIYVEDGKQIYGEKFGITFNCHMMSDNSIEELILFAEKIGLKKEWLQILGKYPHYDINESKRILAIKNGAKVISIKEMVNLCCPK
jgi:hypothetical protein